ncbi:MAG: hypothetical protein LBF93_02330 [Zoogloeaceae bacterium]|jgi:hypothetical protein|nr:hypothetical protein [Zoogloeaceae bacterium]
MSGLPSPTLMESRRILETLYANFDELAEQAALLGAQIIAQRGYVKRALEGVLNSEREDDDD